MAEEKMESKHEMEQEREGRKHGGHAGKHMTHGGSRMASGGHMELNTEGPHPGHPSADEGRHEGDKKGGRAKRARGGKSGDGEASEHEKAQEYNAVGSNEMKEADDQTPGFKKGGAKHHKRRSGGHAEGKMSDHRLDRRPRRAMGGKAGHNPYSSAADMSAPANVESARGYEGKPKAG